VQGKVEIPLWKSSPSCSIHRSAWKGNSLKFIFRNLHRHTVSPRVKSALDPAGVEKATRLGADEIMDKLAPLEEVLSTVRRLGST
jgi:hypothetical protein